MKNFTYSRSPKMRILSAFMAFLIFSLTFTDLIGQVGIRVQADEFTYSDSSIITTDSTKTHFSGIKNVTDGIYSYTGNLQTAKVSMFDYVSDAEFISGLGYSYNNLSHTTPYGGYDDAFTAFNYALSNSASSIKTSSNQNTTIKFKSTDNKCSRAYVYFWGSTTACPLGWPGIPMTFNPTDNCFYLTIPNSVLGSNAKATPHISRKILKPKKNTRQSSRV